MLRAAVAVAGLLLAALVAGAAAGGDAEGARFCFISHGCWGGAGVPAQRAVAAQMGATAAEYNARFVIAAGDNVYTRGVTSVDDPKFKAVFEGVYTHPALQGIPFVTALGNHDYRGNFWAQVNYTQRSSRWYMPYPYYERRFPEASLTVVVLDCPLLERCDANRGRPRWQHRCWDHERQHAWLSETLAGAARDGVRWRVVVCHYPMYANGPHVNHQWLIDLVEPAMRKYSAHLYINADNHYLQVAKKDGLAFFNSGGGAGYQPHKRTDRGYAVNRHNVYEAMSMGIGLHCLEEGEGVLRTRLIDPRGNVLYTFDVPPADGTPKHGAAANLQSLGSASQRRPPPGDGGALPAVDTDVEIGVAESLPPRHAAGGQDPVAGDAGDVRGDDADGHDRGSVPDSGRGSGPVFGLPGVFFLLAGTVFLVAVALRRPTGPGRPRPPGLLPK